MKAYFSESYINEMDFTMLRSPIPGSGSIAPFHFFISSGVRLESGVSFATHFALTA